MQKIKHFLDSDKGKDILIVLIVILVGLSCFELGRLSKDNDSSGIKIQYPDTNTNQTANTVSMTDFNEYTGEVPNIANYTQKDISGLNKNFFASNKGSKYYSLGCGAGKTIKLENRIYFTTGEEAENAGYELSSSCR